MVQSRIVKCSVVRACVEFDSDSEYYVIPNSDFTFIQVKSDNRGNFAYVWSQIRMVEFDIPSLLYAIIASGIAWFLLWLVYDIMKIWQFLKPLAFTNLTLAICLIVFVILGGIEQLKKALRKRT